MSRAYMAGCIPNVRMYVVLYSVLVCGHALTFVFFYAYTNTWHPFKVEKAALDGAKAAAAAGLPAGQASVLRLDFGNNGKVNSAVMKLLQKACPTGAFLVVSADNDNDAVCVFGNAGKVTGVDAKAWCDAALAPLGDGATSGGKAMAAMGSGPGAGLVDAVVAAAKASVA